MLQFSQFTPRTIMLAFSGFAPCSDLATRQIKWIARGDQIKNGSRPGSYINWGISAVSIAAQYAEVHADEVKVFS